MHSDIEKINNLNYSLFKFRNNILIFRCIFRFMHLNLNKNKHLLSHGHEGLVGGRYGPILHCRHEVRIVHGVG